MTLFWLWVSAGCAASGLAGFSAVRFAARGLWTDGPEVAMPTRPEPGRTAIAATGASAVERERPTRPAAPRAQKVAPAESAPAPPPTVARPEAAKLALWARQVKAGERKMTVATDGCRVTWNRACKHGHPSWLVHLGYLKRQPAPKRHNPR